MATISENLKNLKEVKLDILDALKEKNSIPTGGLVTYADAIRNISGDELNAKCEVTFNDDVVALKVEMAQEDITSDVVSVGYVAVPKITGDLNIKISEYKFITYILNQVELSNQQNRIPVSYKYETDLNCDYGYEFDDVVVMMGGVNVTDSVFKTTSVKNDAGKILIEEVSGDIAISVHCKLKTYSITNSNSHNSSNNSASQITHGQSYNALITADDHYELTSVNVVMDGEVIIDESWDELDGQHTFEINIAQVTEDVVITTEAKQVIVVTNVLNNVSSSNSQTKYRYGETYETVLSTTKYFDFTDIHFDGNNFGSIEGPSVLDEDTRIRTKNIILDHLKDDVTLYAAAERVQYTIEYNLTNTDSNTSRNTILEGENFTAQFTPIQYFEFNSVEVSHKGSDALSNFDESTGKLLINEVIGNIVVTIVSTNIVCTVTNVLDGEISTNNNATTALMGQPYYELLTLDTTTKDYMTANVTMGGEAIDYHNMANGEINIPIVLGDILVTANSFVDNLTQYRTLDHYTMEDINDLESGQSLEVILASPRIDHGYTFGYNGTKNTSIGNGYKTLNLMQHNIASVSNDEQYFMTLSKTQDTKMEDVFGPIVKTFSVSGSLYNSNITKLNSTISGYDLYGLSANLSISRGNTRTGTVTITFNGKAAPNTNVYARMYASTTGGTTNITANGTTINPTTSTSTANLNEFTAVKMNSMTLTMNLSANNNGGIFAGNRNYNVYFLVPNNVTEIDVVGQEEVPDGLPYFTLQTKLGSKSITAPDDLRAAPDGFNIFNVNEITSSNQTIGLLPHNNPCVFKFSRISDNKLLSSGQEIGSLTFANSEDDSTVWYLYKPNSSGFSTSSVTVTQHLTNVTSSNSANSVAYGGSYTTTMSWDLTKTPYKIRITMCDHDITDAVYNETTKQIDIPYVIGNVEILFAVVDAEDMKKIRYNLIDVAGVINKTGYSESMSTPDYDAVLLDDKYTAQPTFNGLTKLSATNFEMDIEPSQYQYMKITECYAEMEGVRYDNIYDAAKNTITIQRITGDCLITIKALYIIGYVEDNYYDTDKSNNHIFVEADAIGLGSYDVKFTKIGEMAGSDYNNLTSFNI